MSPYGDTALVETFRKVGGTSEFVWGTRSKVVFRDLLDFFQVDPRRLVDAVPKLSHNAA